MAKTPSPTRAAARRGETPAAAAQSVELDLLETAEFERMTGVKFMTASARMQPRVCMSHRIETRGCADCREARAGVAAEREAAGLPAASGPLEAMCSGHAWDMAACDKCGTIDVALAGAFIYLLRRRDEPELEWDAFQRDMHPTEVIAALGFTAAVPPEEPASA